MELVKHAIIKSVVAYALGINRKNIYRTSIKDLNDAALKAAILKTGVLPKIFHTDQGKEYMAQAVIDFLEKNGVNISVSDKASPWQNGYQESLFGRFKEEAGDLNRFETTGEFIEAIYGQIYYYNYERIHTSLRMPPAVYAQQYS